MYSMKCQRPDSLVPQTLYRHLPPTPCPKTSAHANHPSDLGSSQPLQLSISLHGDLPMFTNRSLRETHPEYLSQLADTFQWKPFGKGKCLPGRVNMSTSYAHAAMIGTSDLIFAILPVFVVCYSSL